MSIAEIFPHGDGDRFVYVFEARDNGRLVNQGVWVQRVKAIGSNGEFEVDDQVNGAPASGNRFRDTGDAIEVLSEDYPSEGVRLTFDPPLPLIRAPLRTGEQWTSATAHVTRLKDGHTEGSLRVSQTVQISAVPPGKTHVGKYDQGILLRISRTTQGSKADLRLDLSAVLVPGIGEIRSEGREDESPVVHRELACAVISGKKIGDCKGLESLLKRPQQ